MHLTSNVYVYYQRRLSNSIFLKVNIAVVKKSTVALNTHLWLASATRLAQEAGCLRQAAAGGGPQPPVGESVAKSHQKVSHPEFLTEDFFVWSLVHSRDDPLYWNLEFYLHLKKGKNSLSFKNKTKTPRKTHLLTIPILTPPLVTPFLFCWSTLLITCTNPFWASRLGSRVNSITKMDLIALDQGKLFLNHSFVNISYTTLGHLAIYLTAM